MTKVVAYKECPACHGEGSWEIESGDEQHGLVRRCVPCVGEGIIQDTEKTTALFTLIEVLTAPAPHSFCPSCGSPRHKECLDRCPRKLSRFIKGV